jgi:small subunit ribosomal protein S18
MSKKNIQLSEVHYTNVKLLRSFLTPAGSIIPRSKTGVSAKIQRKLSQEMKRARFLALVPYVTMN